MTSHRLDILNKDLFPSFYDLPYDNSYDVSFYKEDGYGVLNPRRHWCFLTEVTQCVPWIRPTYHAKDAEGTEILIAFHTEDRSPHILAQCDVGDTLAIMYANSHGFADGQLGIRVESDDMVKILHCDLKGVRELAQTMSSESESSIAPK
ncbi:hypothetical protein D9756_010306 [Leucocoprinus leucothites]|uniref:Uncharacterized protein n=1 Tax=Leucocoprinus leucothites TaxID=201217 RepID=A0A8H5CVA5_9AGAR|nr:hypothetical protein D9756_010306 [Leucoagaricus leucothites]